MGKENVEIKLVTYGAGINMFRKGKSNVLERLGSLKKANGKALDYTVCSNTMRGMKVEKSGYVYIRP